MPYVLLMARRVYFKLAVDEDTLMFLGLLSGVIDQALSDVAKPLNREGRSSLYLFKEQVSESSRRSHNN